MNEKIFFISDTELGRGDITDDFKSDASLAAFFKHLTTEYPNTKITVVFNGDSFDFLKMSYQGTQPRYITEEISLWKIDQIIAEHQIVFNAMRDFVKNHNQSYIHFVIGNHDFDLIWPGVQERIREKLSDQTTTPRVTFDYSYQRHDLHAEHGHLQDPFFAHNPAKPIIDYRGKKILNLPWGAYACATELIKIKHQYPHEEALYPSPKAMEQNHNYRRDSKRTTIRVALKSMLLDPIIHLANPTYHFPYLKLAKHFIRYGFEFLDDQKFIDHRTAKILRAYPQKNIFVLGHAHVLTHIKKDRQQVLITDTWRHEYNLENGGTLKPKTYAELTYNDHGTLQNAELKTWKH